jgi:hypothetical protein
MVNSFKPARFLVVFTVAEILSNPLTRINQPDRQEISGPKP